MAVKTTTVYACDGCGKDVKASDLRRFTLTEARLNASGNEVARARTDLCVGCERKLHDQALPLFPEKEREYMAGIIRG